ncbi:MAG: hypothetical protein HC929_07145 [Leptolyngbyaceae cyanobacterium SM2_5_2]|nr:hypothetical protein [Leptolyngbyaceae cyanobacterium SM2_5_2]
MEQAGLFALGLCELMQNTDWQRYGLPADMNLRIALHAGPVYRNVDPITGQVNYIGNHVNHAARIEPITPPGRCTPARLSRLWRRQRMCSPSCVTMWARCFGPSTMEPSRPIMSITFNPIEVTPYA